MDISSYYREHYVNTHYLDGLKSELKATNKALDNLVKAVERGLPLTDSVIGRLNENEERKQALQRAIEVEEARARAAEDDVSIRAYFERYTNADFDDDQVRESNPQKGRMPYSTGSLMMVETRPPRFSPPSTSWTPSGAPVTLISRSSRLSTITEHVPSSPVV